MNGRVVLIGDSLVGKTSIVTYYRKKSLEVIPNNTIGAVMHTFTKHIDEKEVNIEVYDTAGQEKYRSLGPIYYRGANGALADFDLTNHTSFVSLQKWIDTFKESTEHSFVYVVANKSDLKEEWDVTLQEANNFCTANKSKLFYTSALVGEGIDDLFDSLFDEIYDARQNNIQSLQPKNKSSGCC